MFTLAHLSDPHLGPLPTIRGLDLASKRLFGYLNWQRNRSHGFDDQVLDALVEDIHSHDPDHIVVTGDLVNLALSVEFDTARDWLARLGSPDRVTVVPGNHDAYVPAGIPQFIRTWRQYMSSDDDAAEFAHFPFVRRRGPAAFIGLSSAVATPPLMATGRIGAGQASALGALLSVLGNEKCFRIVLIHHPPTAGSTLWTRRLIDANSFRAEIERGGAELILHGHNHQTQIGWLAGASAKVPVVGAAAASTAPRSGHPGGAYNLFQIEGANDSYSCTMIERGIGRAGSTVETLSEHMLSG